MSWMGQNGNIVGMWFVPDDQTVANYVCQAPKISPQTISTPPTDNNLVCMPGYEDVYPKSGKCYYFSPIDAVSSWDDASVTCDEMMNWDYDVDYNTLNCHLVTIDSNQENNNLFNKMTDLGLQSAWIGMSYTGKH